MRKSRQLLLAAVPLLFHAGDALAWGLYTHVYFAQLLVWAVPLLDPELRRAAMRFPRLVMAGACLPDLALVGPRIGTRAFDQNHRWDTAHALIDAAIDDETRALAVGYTSHLLVDVIAHNHFVPAHEKLWLDVPLLTHVAVEWAMDAHLSKHLFATPGELLESEAAVMADFVGQHTGCGAALTGEALRLLARADRFLRGSGLPRACYRMFRLDSGLRRRFDAYIEATAMRLGQINRVLANEAPAWEAELLCPVTKQAHLAQFSKDELSALMPLPQDLFAREAA